jgi:hypothetical protein
MATSRTTTSDLADARAEADQRIHRAVLQGEAIGELLSHLSNSTRAQVMGLTALAETGNRLALSLVGQLVDVLHARPFSVQEAVTERLALLRRELVQLARVLMAGDEAEEMDTGQLAALDAGAAAIRDNARGAADDRTVVLGVPTVDPNLHRHRRDGGELLTHSHNGGGTAHPHWENQDLVDAATDWLPGVDGGERMPAQVGEQEHDGGEASAPTSSCDTDDGGQP